MRRLQSWQMTNPTPLSPAAQAVLDAACTGNAEGDVMGAAAATLRAAAKGLWSNSWPSSPLGTLLKCQDQLYAIAAELEGIVE